MITKNDIIKMAKHITKRSSGRPDGRIMHPRRDWAIGFLFSLVVLLSGVCYAGYVFYTAWEYNPDSYEVFVAPVKYDPDFVDEVLELYVKKADRFETLRAREAVGTTFDAENETEDAEESGVREENQIEVVGDDEEVVEVEQNPVVDDTEVSVE